MKLKNYFKKKGSVLVGLHTFLCERIRIEIHLLIQVGLILYLDKRMAYFNGEETHQSLNQQHNQNDRSYG